MTLPIPVEVFLVSVREVVRALASPLHALWFLPTRRAHLRRSEAALAASIGEDRSDAREAFLRAHAPRDGRTGTLFVSCGETSGETHALHLVGAVERACRETGRRPPRWIGFGGARLRERGVDVRFPLADHAVMGIGGVLASIPTILRVFATYLRALRDDRPDACVLVDYPGLHLVMAEAARRRGIPVVHYVAPQYWAWGPWRMRRYRRAVDATLTILPFEPAFFGGRELASDYVGHPLLDELAAHPPDETTVEAARAVPTLVLMPGSRRKEIAHHLEPMLRVAERLRRTRPDLRVVIPHRDPRRAAMVREELARLGALENVEVHEGDPAPWLRGARAVLAKSGTGSLEACLHGTPTVVVYAIRGAFARFMLRRMLTVPFFAGANLCMARCIVPEIAVEADAQWDGEVHDPLARLLDDGPDRARCLSDLAALRERLGEPGASERAARWILPFCQTAPEPS